MPIRPLPMLVGIGLLALITWMTGVAGYLLHPVAALSTLVVPACWVLAWGGQVGPFGGGASALSRGASALLGATVSALLGVAGALGGWTWQQVHAASAEPPGVGAEVAWLWTTLLSLALVWGPAVISGYSRSSTRGG